jgi:hypothetical protein
VNIKAAPQLTNAIKYAVAMAMNALASLGIFF